MCEHKFFKVIGTHKFCTVCGQLIDNTFTEAKKSTSAPVTTPETIQSTLKGNNAKKGAKSNHGIDKKNA